MQRIRHAQGCRGRDRAGERFLVGHSVPVCDTEIFPDNPEASVDPEIQEVAELLFSRRLEAFRDAIDADTNDAANDDSSAMARGARVAACGELFRRPLLRSVLTGLRRPSCDLRRALGSRWARLDLRGTHRRCCIRASRNARRYRPSRAESSLESSGKHQIRNRGRSPRRDRARTQSEGTQRKRRQRPYRSCRARRSTPPRPARRLRPRPRPRGGRG